MMQLKVMMIDMRRVERRTRESTIEKRGEVKVKEMMMIVKRLKITSALHEQ